MQKIEHGIEPLVNSLNGIDGIKTQFSCHGHMDRRKAWVIFSCANLDIPYKLWEDLRTISAGVRLSYYWTIKPHSILYGGIPGFIIEANPYRFLTCLRKEKLLKDIENLNKLFLTGKDKENKKAQDNGYYEDKRLISASPASTGVFSLAVGAPVGIRGNLSVTPVTFNKLCHEIIYQMTMQKTRGKSAKNSGIIATVMTSLENSLHLWHLAETLRTLYFENAYDSWPEIDGCFFANRQVFLKIFTKQIYGKF